VCYNARVRIVSGKYRGKKLRNFDLSSTRPTLDNVREAIFDSIQFDVSGAVVLDLFAGTGAMGIEAISRGASKVYFVDNNLASVKLVKDNLIGIDGNYEVYTKDAIEFLNNTKLQFDIIFLDPPYQTNLYKDCIDIIQEKNLLNKGGILIIEDDCNDKQVLDLKNFFVKEKRYGRVKVLKCTKE